MSQQEFWTQMYELLNRYDLTRHTFCEAWTKGELRLGDLREYACQYYHHVAFFPVYLREFGARLPDGRLRNAVLDNLRSTLGMSHNAGRAHNLLWLDFAVGTGALPNDVLEGKPIVEVKSLVQDLLTLAGEGTWVEVLAAFYLHESLFSRLAKQKVRELRTLYGLDESSCNYFTLHAAGGAGHALVWCEQLEELLRHDSKVGNQAISAGERTARALWRALDGINAKRGLRARPKSRFN